MRRLGVSLFLICLMALTACSQTKTPNGVFDRFFIDKTMRIDYFHVGDAQEEMATIDFVYQYGTWGGSLHNLEDPFDNGRYYAKIYDLESGELIFSKGFDSYFGEYKTTNQALDGVKRTYHETILVPYPKNKIKFTLEARNKENKLQPFFSQEIDPASVEVIKDPLVQDVKVYELRKSGDPHNKVDVAIIAEGYTLQEQEKLQNDLQRFTDVFFGHEPYKSYADRFNIYGVFKPSEESGCDEPRMGIFKNTAIDATFNSLGSERYLMTENNRALRDVAAHVPYDALYIMVNHKRYGGGGIYNLYCTFTADNQWYKYLFLHEFGHSFAGLGDEYYTSSVAYNEFYPKGVEPTEPNITALLDPDNLKWKEYVSEGIDVPTPWEKQMYDEMDMAYQKIREELNDKIARLKRNNAPQDEILKTEQESEELSKNHADKVDAYLAKSQFYGKVGAFEGAGYSAQGLFRPMLDCLMFTKGDKPFCKVCEMAVLRIIRFYTE
jgi:hypothetical protein